MGRNNKDFMGGQSSESDDGFDYRTAKRVTGKDFNPKPPKTMNTRTWNPAIDDYAAWYEEKHT
jgi:hypothetical protein